MVASAREPWFANMDAEQNAASVCALPCSDEKKKRGRVKQCLAVFKIMNIVNQCDDASFDFLVSRLRRGRQQIEILNELSITVFAVLRLQSSRSLLSLLKNSCELN